MNPATYILKARRQNDDSTINKIFDSLSITAVISQLVFLIVETIPEFQQTSWFKFLQFYPLAVFALDYIIRISIIRKKNFKNILNFHIRSYGFIDLIVVIATTCSLYSVTTVPIGIKLFQLTGVLKLFHYSSSTETFINVIKKEIQLIQVFFFSTIVLMFVCSYLFYSVEHAAQPEKFKTIFDCFYYVCTTFSTVGYGDLNATTQMGRCLTILFQFLGCTGLFGAPTTILIAGFISEESKIACSSPKNLTKGNVLDWFETLSIAQQESVIKSLSASKRLVA